MTHDTLCLVLQLTRLHPRHVDKHYVSKNRRCKQLRKNFEAPQSLRNESNHSCRHLGLHLCPLPGQDFILKSAKIRGRKQGQPSSCHGSQIHCLGLCKGQGFRHKPPHKPSTQNLNADQWHSPQVCANPDRDSRHYATAMN